MQGFIYVFSDRYLCSIKAHRKKRRNHSTKCDTNSERCYVLRQNNSGNFLRIQPKGRYYAQSLKKKNYYYDFILC